MQIIGSRKLLDWVKAIVLMQIKYADQIYIILLAKFHLVSFLSARNQ